MTNYLLRVEDSYNGTTYYQIREAASPRQAFEAWAEGEDGNLTIWMSDTTAIYQFEDSTERVEVTELSAIPTR